MKINILLLSFTLFHSCKPVKNVSESKQSNEGLKKVHTTPLIPASAKLRSSEKFIAANKEKFNETIDNIYKIYRNQLPSLRRPKGMSSFPSR